MITTQHHEFIPGHIHHTTIPWKELIGILYLFLNWFLLKPLLSSLCDVNRCNKISWFHHKIAQNIMITPLTLRLRNCLELAFRIDTMICQLHYRFIFSSFKMFKMSMRVLMQLIMCLLIWKKRRRRKKTATFIQIPRKHDENRVKD